VFDIEIDAGDREAARDRLSEACQKLLANMIVENYSVELV
jgi:phosphoribosylformylglycinamidine synthase subunit PurS